MPGDEAGGDDELITKTQLTLFRISDEGGVMTMTKEASAACPRARELCPPSRRLPFVSLRAKIPTCVLSRSGC